MNEIGYMRTTRVGRGYTFSARSRGEDRAGRHRVFSWERTEDTDLKNAA